MSTRKRLFHSLSFRIIGLTINAALIIGFLAFAQSLSAQSISSYVFAATSTTFTPLSGATTVTPVFPPTPDFDDGNYGAVPIGFTFRYNGTDYTQVAACTNGWLSFNTTGNFQLNNSLDGTTNVPRPFVAPLFDDLDMTSGTASYLTTGSAPNRIFTMQWLNAKWNLNAPAPSMSFQVKLYETTNRVQFIYRQEAGALGSGGGFGASIGIAGLASGSGNYLSLNNATASPAASSTTDTTTVGTKPATGQSYSFTPPVTAADVSLSGRVLAPDGRGVRRAMVLVLRSDGTQTQTVSGPLGYYRVEGLAAGETVAVSVISRRFIYSSRVVTLNDNVSDLDFYPDNKGARSIDREVKSGLPIIAEPVEIVTRSRRP